MSVLTTFDVGRMVIRIEGDAHGHARRSLPREGRRPSEEDEVGRAEDDVRRVEHLPPSRRAQDPLLNGQVVRRERERRVAAGGFEDLRRVLDEGDAPLL